MGQPKVVEGHFVDRMGRKRTIRKTRYGLQIQRVRSTVPITLNRVVGPLIGKRIQQVRRAKRMSLAALCQRAGLVAAEPKSRMWEIENSIRKEGMRLGTMYAIALALGVEVATLLPTAQEIAEAAGVTFEQPKPAVRLVVGKPQEEHHDR